MQKETLLQGLVMKSDNCIMSEVLYSDVTEMRHLLICKKRSKNTNL